MKTRRILMLPALLLFSALMGNMAESTDLVVHSATPGGSWYPIAVAAGNIWEKNIPGTKVAHKPGGGVGNFLAIDSGKGDVGLSVSVTVGEGVLGISPFKKKHTNVRTLGSLYKQYYYITVLKSSEIKTLGDLKGKRLGAGPKGYTAESLTRKTLEAVGLSYKDMARVDFVPDQQSVDLVKDGHLDAFCDTPASHQDPQQMDLSMFKPIHILPMPDPVLKKLQSESPGIFRDYVPKGAYPGIDADIPVIASNLGIIVRADLAEDLVYKLTKLLVEKWADMQAVSKSIKESEAKFLATSMGVDFHPGALKYYKEIGWVK